MSRGSSRRTRRGSGSTSSGRRVDRFDLGRAAREDGDRVAWIDEGGALTFRELAREARALGDRFGHDLGPHDRVVLTPLLDRASVIALSALLDRRVTIVLAHPRWSERERARIVERTDPRLVIEGGRVIDVRSARPRPRGPAVVVFTSGTSGEPKGACLSRSALLAAAESHAEALPWRDDDRWLLAMPLAHVGGLAIVLRALYARRTVVVGAPHLELDALTAQRITLLSLVPAMLERILPAEAPPTLRAVLIGGAACSSSILARGRAAGWPLLPTYGMSEACGQVCTQRLDDLRPSGVGPPLPSMRVRVVDDVIEVAGPARMDGYLDEAPLSDGAWLRTTDLGRIDEHGHLHVIGRASDRIITGGENVDPLAVEEALRSHPLVRAACVVGIEDEVWGERVAALIVPAGPEPTLASLSEHLADRLARYAHPRVVCFAPELPLSAAGKLDRAAARRIIAAQ